MFNCSIVQWFNWPITFTRLSHGHFFNILCFLPFYGSRNTQNGLFLVNFQRFWQKITLFAHFGTHTIGKNTKYPKEPIWHSSKGKKVPLYKFLCQLDHFPRTSSIFCWNLLFFGTVNIVRFLPLFRFDHYLDKFVFRAKFFMNSPNFFCVASFTHGDIF